MTSMRCSSPAGGPIRLGERRPGAPQRLVDGFTASPAEIPSAASDDRLATISVPAGTDVPDRRSGPWALAT